MATSIREHIVTPIGGIGPFNEKNLKSAISFEAERGYRNAVGRNMRFNNFLRLKLTKLCSQSNHKVAQKLLEEVNGYGTASISDRSKLLNKVSVLMGYRSVQDLLEDERAQTQSGSDLKDVMDDFDFSLAHRRFASIILGSSSPIELYDEIECPSKGRNLLLAQRCEGLPNSVGGKLLDIEKLGETWPSLGPPISDEKSSSLEEENFNVLPLSSLPKGKSVPKATAKESHINLVLEPQQNEASIELPVSPLPILETKGKSVSQATAKESLVTLVLESQQNGVSVELILDRPLSSIPGLSSRHCRQLEKYDFHTMRKLLHHFPRTYADLQNVQGEVDEGNYLISIGKVLSSRGVRATSSFSFLEVVVGCEIGNDEVAAECRCDDHDTMTKKTIYLHLKKFFRGTRFTNQYFLKSLQSKHKEGDFVCVSGKVKTMTMKDHYEMREYNIDIIENEKESHVHGEGRPYPLYPSKGGLNPNFLREVISRALQGLSTDIDPLPRDICQEFDLLSLHNAYMGIHCPKDLNEADLARKRLIFDEFFYLQLGRLFQMLAPLGTWIERDGLLDNYRKHEPSAVVIEEWSSLTKKLLEALPYKLTPSQLNAVSEIIRDLKQPVPMNRLLQGDVGCGKTVVAFLACMEVIGSGYQAAFMVPTELLAIQHYEHLLNLLENIEDQSKPSVALLTGSTTARQSRITRQGLQTGDISLVIGTHSLIADKVEFSALRVAIVDEQHRFGVIQRGTFNSKLYSGSGSLRMNAASTDKLPKDEVYMAPHVLAMTATPIPRTLALALYGDMSLTQITDLPPGRIPVETYVFEGNSVCLENVYQMMRDELQTGGKVYIVYPIIETSEQQPQLRAASTDLETVSREFEGYACGLLHGRMKSDEKEEALRRFRSGETRILLSTQVIEIGVDVPDASMMVIMNAERFGIAQLHQLRGRVGRGLRKSKCVFLSSAASGLNRLKVLEKSSDGFYLANMDLLLRGPGDLLGKKQSGHIPEFPIARLEVDGSILEDAHIAALKILSTSHDLERYPQLKAELSMRQPLCILGD
ncbi:Helicase [Macleaya cordata]|uniref:DNA 3'-5' helicase n=1 Tax=Macleaya cordata TaxID=56857 RepID=A0A200PU94_MACCD|nr:Helicase [Macleaya cordata]